MSRRKPAMPGKRKPKFRVGQVVAMTLTPRNPYRLITYVIERPELATFQYIFASEDSELQGGLRHLSNSERGPA